MALPGSLPELVHLAINGGYGLQLIFCPGEVRLFRLLIISAHAGFVRV